MPKEISYGACLEFQQSREAVENNKFHACQEIIGVKKWWEVVYKKNNEIFQIKGTLSKLKAEKLALALNTALEK